MIAEIAGAKVSIALQTYILDDDETGARFRDALIERARGGCRRPHALRLDRRRRLVAQFIQSFRDGGVKVFPFLPFHPFKRRWQVNLRNHRKILVVDGQDRSSGA